MDTGITSNYKENEIFTYGSSKGNINGASIENKAFTVTQCKDDIGGSIRGSISETNIAGKNQNANLKIGTANCGVSASISKTGAKFANGGSVSLIEGYAEKSINLGPVKITGNATGKFITAGANIEGGVNFKDNKGIKHLMCGKASASLGVGGGVGVDVTVDEKELKKDLEKAYNVLKEDNPDVSRNMIRFRNSN